MALDLGTVKRFSRQLALPAIGPEGQARLLAAEVALVGDDAATETAARYLLGAGVRKLRVASRNDDAGSRWRALLEPQDAAVRVTAVSWPVDGPAWVEALRGSSLVVRSGFDDDPMLRACVRLGVPVMAIRVRADLVDLLSFRRHGPCPHVALDVPLLSSGDAPLEGATAVVAGTLAAAEAAQLIVDPAAPPRARHLRWTLVRGEPRTQEIPWAPECFACGGQGREAVFS